MSRWLILPMLCAASWLVLAGCGDAGDSSTGDSSTRDSSTVESFMRTWVLSGASSAAELMDSRSASSAAELAKLKDSMGVSSDVELPESVVWMDSRTPDTKGIVQMRRGVQFSLISLKSWDGKISSIGDSTWTDRTTGNQHDTRVYRVMPVMESFGGRFIPVTIEVSVAKDSGKVFIIELSPK